MLMDEALGYRVTKTLPALSMFALNLYFSIWGNLDITDRIISRKTL